MAAFTSLSSPFGSEAIVEVPLPDAPLALTLAQIRFPSLSALADEHAAGDVVSRLKDAYPSFAREHEVGFLLTPDGVTSQQQGETIWRVQSEDGGWKVGFSSGFLSLETTDYSSREDFCERLGEAWRAFVEVVGEPGVQRIGFRYVNRVSERPFLDQLGTMVRPELVGAMFVGANAAPVAQSMAQNLYARSESDQLLARWGILAPGETFLPSVPALDRHSWLLDLDSFRSFEQPTKGVDAVGVARDLGEAAYRFFRWAVTKEFLQHFGGEV
ncbi:TIGR04255 family protein [Nocardioides panzhihuensis]|uniref:Uncharacterized protein (TIGR04255 family) n=1 Tax=Nocardioides panzhihuensis TaxID=860243 RepID=A0A7Z0IUW1_9ACTN|nr:uncharacterized protein (TIGR04255 family) [Nocardioides panzhihuensis]